MIGMYFLNKFSRGIKLNMEGLEKGDNSELNLETTGMSMVLTPMR